MAHVFFLAFFLLSYRVLSSPNENQVLQANDLGLLESAVSLQRKVGDSVWPGFGSYQTATIYVTERGQVLLNASAALAGYSVYDGKSPTWARSAFFTRKRLAPDGDEFTQKEFDSSYFASAYSPLTTNGIIKESVFFVDSLDRFHAKKMMWSAEDWLSIFWHEVFHNFQDTRYSAGRVSQSMLDFSKIKPLLDSPDYLKLVQSELQLLSQILHEKSAAKKHQMICRNLRSVRGQRAQFLESKNDAQDTLLTEQFYELSEGTARYLEEMMSLQSAKLPSEELRAATRSLGGHEDYRGFEKFKQRNLQTYYDRIATLASGDRYYYQT